MYSCYWIIFVKFFISTDKFLDYFVWDMYFYFWCILPNYISQRFYHLYSLAVYESFMFILAIQEYNIENID